MEVTHLLVVCLLVGPGTLPPTRAEKRAEEVTGEAPITEDQKKVYDECRNPDYKKYVKCLMRPKRHHTNHGDGLPETGRSPIAITIRDKHGNSRAAREPPFKHLLCNCSCCTITSRDKSSY